MTAPTIWDISVAESTEQAFPVHSLWDIGDCGIDIGSEQVVKLNVNESWKTASPVKLLQGKGKSLWHLFHFQSIYALVTMSHINTLKINKAYAYFDNSEITSVF